MEEIKIDEIKIEEKTLDFAGNESSVDMGEFRIDLGDDLKSGSQIINDEARYRKPLHHKHINAKTVSYKNAVKMAKEIGLPKKDESYFSFVSGNFIYGDLIEAFCVENNLLVDEMIISTLSLSQDNIDSLHNLIAGNYVQNMHLIVSEYFWNAESRKFKFPMRDYLFQELDIDNKFQFSVCGVHIKMILIKSGENYFVFDGSANLRSSQNIEQINIRNDKKIYEYSKGIFDKVQDNFYIINKDNMLDNKTPRDPEKLKSLRGRKTNDLI